MPRKAKPTKHTAKELARKQKIRDAVKVKKSGKSNKELKDTRNPLKKTYECPLCHLFVPDPKTMEIHWNSKHSKLPFNIDDCTIGGDAKPNPPAAKPPAAKPPAAKPASNNKCEEKEKESNNNNKGKAKK